MDNDCLGMGELIQFPQTQDNTTRLNDAILLATDQVAIFVYPDGSVVVEGDIDEASQVFWDAVAGRVYSAWSETDLGIYVDEVDRLDRENKKLRKRLKKCGKKRK